MARVSSLLLIWLLGSSQLAVGKEPVEWVNPLIGTGSSHTQRINEDEQETLKTIGVEAGGRWFFFASASRPFGMVTLHPDMELKGTWRTGYLYDKNRIRGFSHVHAFQLGGIPVMPTTGPMRGPEGSDVYGSAYSHKTELVECGYHAVTLDDYGIRVELTSTRRVGFHRYTFPKSDESHVLFDLGAQCGPAPSSDAMVRRVSPSEVEGYVVNAPTQRRPKPCTIYFVARFDKSFQSFGVWKDKVARDGVDEVSGKHIGAYVTYATEDCESIQMKVGISYVSAEQARLNLETELPHWNFSQIRNESRREWNEWLSKIEVEGGTDVQKTRFYTDLFHVLLGRHITSDVNGKYCDLTGPKPIVRQIPLNTNGRPEYCHFNSDAFWTTFWNVNQIWALAYPELTSQWVRFLLDMYHDGGLIPRGPSGHNYTFVMIAAHSTPFIVGAYMKNIRNFDAELAYEGMRKNHFPGGLMSKAGYEHDTCKDGGIEYYIKRGYIPDGRHTTHIHADGAAQTLEYAYDDWCLAQMARALGKHDDYHLFSERSQNYRNVFDRSTGFMRPRRLDGSWWTPFDPKATTGWCEATAWHYTWFVPHDVVGLATLMGGREAFNQKLNHAFELAAADRFRNAYVNYGNQPSTAMAHLFNYTGAPWLTQKWVRAVKKVALSGVTPDDGYGGDEDQGQGGGISLLMALGLFEVRGGCALDPIYEITSPIFDRITIHLDRRYYPGKKFEILVRNNSVSNDYVQSAKLNGKRLEHPWLYHRQLVAGGTLELELGSEPNKQWGSRPKDAPPSMSAQMEEGF